MDSLFFSSQHFMNYSITSSVHSISRIIQPLCSSFQSNHQSHVAAHFIHHFTALASVIIYSADCISLFENYSSITAFINHQHLFVPDYSAVIIHTVVRQLSSIQEASISRSLVEALQSFLKHISL